MKSVSELLSAGNPRTLGKTHEIAERIQHDETLFADAFREMLHNPNQMTRLRAGNAVEKASREKPELLLPFKADLLAALPEMQDPTIVWHVALLLGYINLEDDDLALAVNKLYEWLGTIDHRFVKVNCLQTLGVLALQHAWLKPEVTETLKAALETDNPASIKARSRILLKKLEPKRKHQGLLP